MTGNESMSSGDSPGDGTACMVGVHDPSVLNKSVPWPSVQGRLEWIDEQVAVAVASYVKIPHSGSLRFDACQILGVVTEFAELLRVHYAGGE